MNRRTTLSLIFAFLAFGTYAQKTWTLEEIKTHADFELTIAANGGYSGNSVALTIQSNARKDIEVLVPAGTVFFTSDENDQILITVEEELIAVAKGQKRKKILDGYCTEAGDGVPEAEMPMDFMPSRREKLQHLANFINRHPGLEEHAIQEAVWCVADGNPLAYIYGQQDKKTKLLTEFVATLTGQEMPWNTVKRQHEVSGRHINSRAVLVTGSVSFATTKETTVKGQIIDADGNIINDALDTMALPKTNNARLNFSLSVAGWSSGTYYVVYTDQDEQVLLKKAFEI